MKELIKKVESFIKIRGKVISGLEGRSFRFDEFSTKNSEKDEEWEVDDVISPTLILRDLIYLIAARDEPGRHLPSGSMFSTPGYCSECYNIKKDEKWRMKDDRRFVHYEIN